jgi:hypothetical protein
VLNLEILELFLGEVEVEGTRRQATLDNQEVRGVQLLLVHQVQLVFIILAKFMVEVEEEVQVLVLPFFLQFLELFISQEEEEEEE